MRMAVYSAIYGGYDRPKPVFNVGADCVLFTDDPDLDAPGWQVRYEPLGWISTPMLRAKYWKTHPDVALPGVDLSVWIDGSIIPKPRFAANCRDAAAKVDVAFTPHPLRNCIYTELDASRLPKYEPHAVMERQVNYYRKAGHPERWGLFASGVMVRRHHRRVLQVMQDWWVENTTWSWQDQLSLPFVVRRHPEVAWDTTLPWAQWWDYQEHGT